jgi:hypothetical protein
MEKMEVEAMYCDAGWAGKGWGFGGIRRPSVSPAVVAPLVTHASSTTTHTPTTPHCIDPLTCSVDIIKEGQRK